MLLYCTVCVCIFKSLQLLRIRDPNFNTSFWHEVTGITTSQSRKKESQWVSMKELHDKYGDDAHDMASALLKRRNPQCTKFWQYLITDDKNTLEFVQFKRGRARVQPRLQVNNMMPSPSPWPWR